METAENRINEKELGMSSKQEDSDLKIEESAAFADLVPSKTLTAILEKQGFTAATPVQKETIPPALEGKDLIIQAQTGSGKTLAFGIPLLLNESVKNNKADVTTALVVAPTRELACQVSGVLEKLSEDTTPVLLIGGEPLKVQRKALQHDARIVVGTPGRILDMIRQRALNLKRCGFFVLDEVDEMFSMGFFEDVRAILARLPRKRQGLFLSATVSPRVQMLAGSFLTKPENIIVDEIGKDLPPIEHCYCNVGAEMTAKPDALADFIETMRPRSAIIFCNTKSDTELVEVYLRRRGFDARRINSDLGQSQRTKIMQKIRKQELQFLVATDIAARGLDIEQIELVVNYSLHEESDIYFHRTGRTGRAGKSGRALSLVGPQDFMAFHRLRKQTDAEFKELPLPTNDDVADARLAHIYELLRLSELNCSVRDYLVAQKFLKEVGGVEEAPEDLQEMLSKLCLSMVEHSMAVNTRSLDEELDDELKRHREHNSRNKSKNGNNQRKRRRQNSRNTRSRGKKRQR
jgi:ATP-dependent RNA helicase DeaD